MVTEQLYNAVITYISQWGYTAILVGMLLESANVPIPSELIFGFAGYLVYLGKLSFSGAVWAGMTGGLLGSIISYMIGYFGGPSFVSKYGKYVFLSEGKMRLAQHWFERYGLLATLLGRLLPVVRTFISLPAGFARVNFIKFIIYTLMGSLPWTVALVYAGMTLGENWQTLRSSGHTASLIIAGAIAVFLAWLVFKKQNDR